MIRLLRLFLVFLFILLILLAVFVWSPFLRIRTIDVTGQERSTTEEILRAAGLKSGDHPLLPLRIDSNRFPATRLAVAAEQVMKLPWVRTAAVEWLPLHAVRIRVTERVPYAALSHMGGKLLMDREGIVLQAVEGELPNHIKEIRGIRFTSYANGRIPDMEDPELLQTGLRVLAACVQSESETAGFRFYETISWIDVLSLDRVLISLEDRIAVRLNPLEELQYSTDFAAEIFFRHLDPGERGMIDFTRGTDPAFIPD